MSFDGLAAMQHLQGILGSARYPTIATALQENLVNPGAPELRKVGEYPRKAAAEHRKNEGGCTFVRDLLAEILPQLRVDESKFPVCNEVYVVYTTQRRTPERK